MECHVDSNQESVTKELILIDVEEVHAIRDTAKKLGTAVSIGFSEKVSYSIVTLCNAKTGTDSKGKILTCPSSKTSSKPSFKRLTSSPNNGHGLHIATIAETKERKISALICE
jgi:hypothetical protein